MKCLIIDDNKMARMAMRQLVSQVQSLELVAECSDAIEAYNQLTREPIDLLLLDIEMPDMTGIELTKKLGPNNRPLIIFTTAKTDYAVEAFELNVVDYLVKPVTLARFLQALERAKEATESKRQDVKIEAQEFVFVKDNGVLKKLNVDDILFLEAMGDYVKVHTGQKFHVLHSTLKAIEEKLPAAKFLRVHRSYIVALNKIDYIQDGSIYIGKASVPLAETYKVMLNKRLNML
ncbi:two component transcriptional regulator, LytTR family [Cnuella takakiae]|uniref:Two component transcriptional regulator, LytTR family n=1 Tax=Cnuella takakiae TaxID=1302690 RepID=A0A1M4XBS8_9BACT|nr:LytTR family DNA-binding domain-containing protein [Cnuella takakiae]OLY91473.1 DNA-binding response regulator [Cnuella takakiae]SHE90903.1 two component transcriptional regulator, LytTR family [Cnuella takakiae]